jgi:hypothetical protein
MSTENSGPKSRLRGLLGRIANVPPEALLVGLALFAILAAFVAADPDRVTRITDSVSPFTDEAFNVVNARNVVQLGTWSTDEWNLYLVNLPFSLFEAAAFWLMGAGIVQARLAMILCTSLTAGAIVWGLRGVVDRIWAVFAGLAFAFSGLILFYGRLAFLEDFVVLGLSLGTLVLARNGGLSLRGGAVSGVCYALAIGAKPNALFAITGILATVAVVWALHDLRARRWLLACAAVIGLAGVFWLLAIWLPNRSAVATDLKIWAQFQWSLSPLDMLNSVRAYLTGKSDHLFSFLLLPLLVMGVAGLLAIVPLRRRLSEAQGRLAAAAFGWSAFGFGILMLASYRPNRYVVPLVPALAILAAIGLHLFAGWLRERLAGRGGAPAARAPRLATAAMAALAIVIAVGPGLAWYGTWAHRARYDLVAIQNQYAQAVPAGQIVAGDNAALFFMTSKARTFILDQANNGDIYAQGTRYYLMTINPATPDYLATPNGVPEAVWAARERVMCSAWRGSDTCLFHLK